MDCILSILMLCKIDNIHYERVTDCTDSTLHGYNIMSIVCTLYGYQDSALNHMLPDFNPLVPVVDKSTTTALTTEQEPA